MRKTKPSFAADRLMSHADACAAVALVVVLGFTQSAFAYPGEQVLNWTANNILAPVSLLAIVVGIAVGMFNTQLIKHAAYVFFISAILFTVIKAAPAIMTAMKN